MNISMYLANLLNWLSCSSVLSYGSCRIQLSKTTKLFTYIAKDTIFSLGKQKCGFWYIIMWFLVNSFVVYELLSLF